MKLPVSHRPSFVCCVAILIGLVGGVVRGQAPFGGHVTTEFIYESASFPQCHASTVAETPDGLIAAWFGGTREKHPDVGIWVARRIGDKWTAPVEVANGIQQDSLRFPCWNPVLFQIAGGPLHLYYKVGPSPSEWWGMVRVSTDHGISWGAAKRLPDGILGPIKNKPVMLGDGRLVSGSSTEDDGWRVHIESTNDLGFRWNRSQPLNDGKTIQAIQPALLIHSGKRLQILCRGRGTGRIVTAWSEDNGRKWSELQAIDLPNPNSGLDAVTLADGRHIVVYNHTARGRSPLNVAISPDGVKWLAAAVLEDVPGEYSYPAVIQTSDGMVHVTYTWQRQRIRHVALDPARLEPREFHNGEWPAP